MTILPTCNYFAPNISMWVLILIVFTFSINPYNLLKKKNNELLLININMYILPTYNFLLEIYRCGYLNSSKFPP